MLGKYNLLKVMSGIFALSFSANIFANGEYTYTYDDGCSYKRGPYVGVQLGLADVDDGKAYNKLVDYNNAMFGNYINYLETDVGTALSGSSDGSFRSDDFGGRIFLGYSFFQYLALEAGYSVLPRRYFNWEGVVNTVSPYEEIDDIIYRKKFKTYAGDLVVKMTLPLDDLEIYAKGGGAYVRAISTNPDVAYSRIRPTYGVGFAYNLTSHFGMDISWTHIEGKNKADFKDFSFNQKFDFSPHVAASKKPIPSSNLYAFGLYYRF